MPDPLLTTTQLARLLQSARKARKLTQAAVGARMDLSQKRISALERDPGSLTANQLLQLCAVLGLELTLGTKAAADGPSRAAHSTAEW